jgi:hypothetical protein
MMAFDPAADGDDQVFVFERHSDGRWHHIAPDPLPAAAYALPAREPVEVRWTETNWVQTVEGWATEFEKSGSFVLDEQTRAKLVAGFREAVAAGRVLMSTTAADDFRRFYLNHHVRAARSS